LGTAEGRQGSRKSSGNYLVTRRRPPFVASSRIPRLPCNTRHEVGCLAILVPIFPDQPCLPAGTSLFCRGVQGRGGIHEISPRPRADRGGHGTQPKTNEDRSRSHKWQAGFLNPFWSGCLLPSLRPSASQAIATSGILVGGKAWWGRLLYQRTCVPPPGMRGSWNKELYLVRR
jgi:hypothetical protein